MNALGCVFRCAFAVSLVALPFLLVNWARFLVGLSSNRSGVWTARGFPIKSVVLFVFPLLAAVAVAHVATTFARHEVLTFVRELPAGYTVFVNSKPATDRGEVLSALKRLARHAAHHSHPTTRIRVEIRAAAGQLTLDLRRDSDVPREYWVYLPEYSVTASNEIGRIITPVFDNY